MLSFQVNPVKLGHHCLEIDRNITARIFVNTGLVQAFILHIVKYYNIGPCSTLLLFVLPLLNCVCVCVCVCVFVCVCVCVLLFFCL
jgi:hypothetical protein